MNQSSRMRFMSQLERKISSSRVAAALPELRRQEAPEEDSLQFLWAVSYCDLLMVLMSFFILFFQVSDSASPSALKNVILSLKGDASIVASEKPVLSAETPSAHVLDQLGKALQSEKIKISQDATGRSIVLDFDPNLYPPRGYAFPKGEQSRLERILSRIKPFSKDLLVTFVGHADEARLLHGKSDVIDSNLVLSNLRATRAVEIAFKLGFDPKGVTGQGAGEFSRNTRSLSIKISERGSP